MTCARCQAEIPAGARFCAACGAPNGVSCPQCAGPVFGGQRFCTGCGADIANAAAAAIPAEDGERRHPTVMFSDLSGYTALNESFDPEEVEALMARVKSDVGAFVDRYGGTVNQSIDALLEIGDLDGVELNCVCIEIYTAQQPLPMSDWIVCRDRALARVACRERGDELAAVLQAPRDEGTRAELFVLLPALDTAIARGAAASPA